MGESGTIGEDGGRANRSWCGDKTGRGTRILLISISHHIRVFDRGPGVEHTHQKVFEGYTT
jgi:hypothetical protein